MEILTKENTGRGKPLLPTAHFQNFHSLSKENQVSLSKRTFLSEPGPRKSKSADLGVGGGKMILIHPFRETIERDQAAPSRQFANKWVVGREMLACPRGVAFPPPPTTQS